MPTGCCSHLLDDPEPKDTALWNSIFFEIGSQTQMAVCDRSQRKTKGSAVFIASRKNFLLIRYVPDKRKNNEQCHNRTAQKFRTENSPILCDALECIGKKLINYRKELKNGIRIKILQGTSFNKAPCVG